MALNEWVLISFVKPVIRQTQGNDLQALLYPGLVVFVIGGLGTLIASFKTSFLWGLGCLLLAPVSLIFLIVHWDVAKNPFFLQLFGLAIMLAASSG